MTGVRNFGVHSCSLVRDASPSDRVLTHFLTPSPRLSLFLTGYNTLLQYFVNQMLTHDLWDLVLGGERRVVEFAVGEH